MTGYVDGASTMIFQAVDMSRTPAGPQREIFVMGCAVKMKFLWVELGVIYWSVDAPELYIIYSITH